MKREEAIDIIQAVKFIDDFEDYSDRLEIALDMAIEALKERPHGEWVYKNGKYWCSSCGEKAIYHSHIQAPLPHLTNFCPNCGADMSANDKQVTGKLNSEIENSKSEIVPDYRDGWRLKEGEAE